MRKYLIDCLIVSIIGSAPAFAHHGTSVTYQTDKTITLTGTVTEFHSRTHILNFTSTSRMPTETSSIGVPNSLPLL